MSSDIRVLFSFGGFSAIDHQRWRWQFQFSSGLAGSVLSHGYNGDSQRTPAGRWRLVSLDVGEADIREARIDVTAGIDIPGKILMEGSPLPRADNRDPGRIIAALRAGPRTQFEFIHSNAVYASQGSMDSGVLQSVAGEFLMKKAQPGNYQLRISGLYCCPSVSILLPAGWAPPYREPIASQFPLRGVYVQSIRVGGTDASSGEIRVDRSTGPLEIRLGTNPAILEGRALSELKEPAGSVTIVVMPTSLRERLDLYQYGTTYTSGVFRFEVAPGDYRVFALRGATEGIWMHPAFLRIYENRGTVVHVDEGGRRSGLDLQVIELPN